MKPRVSSWFLEGLLYALTVFGPLAFGCVEPWSRAALEILAFLLALSCFLRGRPALSPIAGALWLFPAAFAVLGVLQLQTPSAPDGPRPFAPFTSAPNATETAMLLWAAYAAVLWSVPRIITTHEAARRYTRVLFGLGIGIAAVGILQKATAAHKIYWVRPSSGIGDFGPYYNRDHAANLLLMSMAAGLGIFFSRTGHGPRADGFPKERLRSLRSQGLLASGVLFLLLGILASGSRGALLAMPLAGAAVALLGAGFARDARRRRLRAAAALAGACAAVYLAYRFVVAPAEAGTLVDESVMGRLFIYGDSWRWWRDSPLFGTGLGSFETIYPAYQDFSLQEIVMHAHSDWLEITLEAGLLGTFAALVAAALAAFAAVRAWRAARSGEMRALIAGGLAAAAAFSAHSLFEFSFQIPANAVIFLGIVGFLLSAPAWADKSADPDVPQPPAALPCLLAASCFLLLSQAAARPAAFWLANATGDPRERTAAVARAVSSDLNPFSLKSLAAISYDRAGHGDRTDVKALRDALSYSMAASELRPFDSDDLFLAGASLSRLGRPADADVLIDDAKLVRFTPLAALPPDPKADYARMRSNLEAARTLGILPAKATKR